MLNLLIVAVLILFNAFFAMSEIAVVTSRKSRLKALAVHHTGAAKALELAEAPDSFLSAVQLWISLLSLMVGYFGGETMGAQIAVPFHDIPLLAPYAGRIGFVLGFITTLFVFGLLGELVPKRVATIAPERIASVVAWPMVIFARIAMPLVWLLSVCTRGIIRLLGLANVDEQSITEEEIQILVSEGHEQGVIDDDERNMMTRVMRLGDRSAESLMTPRTRIVWLDTEASTRDNIALMREEAFSRYPVYRGNDADVVGTLEVKSLLDNIGDATPSLFSKLRETLFVSESTHAMKLLEIFREEQQSLALVVDEYGDVTGLVTISDVMGAITGRLQSAEHADDEPLVVTREDGSLLVDGSLPVDELRELTASARLPHEDDLDYHTAAGMLIAHFGRIPHVGEYFDWNGWRFEVMDLDGPRIDKLLVQRVVEPAESRGE
ncbi:hemolysin family protein [Solilutibacter silvestris]|uniref:CBS domain-containing/Hemolysin-related protein n=1 Tax=Solilutibacter silvestris TaxID=1645665 RepID=A0A2K1PY04_9GAMM|nr:hemolysin family protein [Lysobacter silvestris]PNS07674.1 CBS domain-containing/Hemolysin-related protein [Lysobacter silvestris]